MRPPVLLFAAGLGTRMGALTQNLPKPLIKVAGKALLDHALDIAKAADIGHKVVNLHYKKEAIAQHLAGQDILFSDESDALLETGGGLRKALPLLNANPILTMNTDAVWKGPNPITTVLKAWDDSMEALLLIIEKTNVAGHLGKGDFEVDANGRLHRAPQSVYTGVQMIRTDVLAEIPEDAFSLNVAWDIIAERGRLFGTTYSGQWCDVGQPSSIKAAEEMLNV